MNVSDVYRFVIEDVINGLKSEANEETLHSLRSIWEAKLIQSGVFSIKDDKEDSFSLSPKRKYSEEEESFSDISTPTLYSTQPMLPFQYNNTSELFMQPTTPKSTDLATQTKSTSPSLTPTTNNNNNNNISPKTSSVLPDNNTISNVQIIQGVDPRYTSPQPKQVSITPPSSITSQTPSPTSPPPTPRSIKLPSFQFVGLSLNPIPFTKESFSGKPAPYLPPVTAGNQVPYVAPANDTPTTKRARTNLGKQLDGIEDNDDFSTPFYGSEIMPLQTGTPTGLTPALPSPLDDENLNSDLDEDEKEPETANIVMCQFEKVQLENLHSNFEDNTSEEQKKVYFERRYYAPERKRLCVL